MQTRRTVVFVGDVQDVRECLEGRVANGQLAILRFDSAGDAVEYCEPQMPGCFVLDQWIRGASAVQVREQLHAKGCQQPFIYVSRDGDVASAVEAMHYGALDCLERPVDQEKLLNCIQVALAQDEDLRRQQASRGAVLARVESLTPRERQVLEYVAAGEITKSIARLLAISPKTVEVHRSNIMRKMQVESAAGLFHLIAKHALFPLVAELSLAQRDPSLDGVAARRCSLPPDEVGQSRIEEPAIHLNGASAISALNGSSPRHAVSSRAPFDRPTREGASPNPSSFRSTTPDWPQREQARNDFLPGG